MTREEQIIKAAKDNGRYDWVHFQAFKEGANWADNHRDWKEIKTKDEFENLEENIPYIFLNEYGYTIDPRGLDLFIKIDSDLFMETGSGICYTINDMIASKFNKYFIL